MKKILLSLIIISLLTGCSPANIGVDDLGANKKDVKIEKKYSQKIDKIINKNHKGSFEKGSLEIEIISIEEIEDGVQLFAKAYVGDENLDLKRTRKKGVDGKGKDIYEQYIYTLKANSKIGFGKDGTVEIERFRIFNPPILVDDENGDIIREWEDEETKEIKQRKLREDPVEAIRQSLAHTIGIVGKDGDKIIEGKVGNTTSTFYPNPGTGTAGMDGFLLRSNNPGTWADIHDGAGTGVDTSGASLIARLNSSATTDRWVDIVRNSVGYNTSPIPETDNIDSATLSLYGVDGDEITGAFGSMALNIYGSTPASNTTLANSDYGNFGSTAFSTEIGTGSWADGRGGGNPAAAYNDFILNAAGIANISKTGISNFGFNVNVDASDTEPTWVSGTKDGARARSADQTGTANDPKLVVEHSEAAATRKFISIQ